MLHIKNFLYIFSVIALLFSINTAYSVEEVKSLCDAVRSVTDEKGKKMSKSMDFFKLWVVGVGQIQTHNQKIN